MREVDRKQEIYLEWRKLLPGDLVLEVSQFKIV